MYIDSGADVSLVPLQFGRALGLQPNKQDIQEIQGIGGRGIAVIMSTVKMRIGRKILEARIAWSLTEDVPLLLGRMDVFDAFKVTFDQAKRKVLFQSP
jgi:Aspartyl protease